LSSFCITRELKKLKLFISSQTNIYQELNGDVSSQTNIYQELNGDTSQYAEISAARNTEFVPLPHELMDGRNQYSCIGVDDETSKQILSEDSDYAIISDEIDVIQPKSTLPAAVSVLETNIESTSEEMESECSALGKGNHSIVNTNT